MFASFLSSQQQKIDYTEWRSPRPFKQLSFLSAPWSGTRLRSTAILLPSSALPLSTFTHSSQYVRLRPRQSLWVYCYYYYFRGGGDRPSRISTLRLQTVRNRSGLNQLEPGDGSTRSILSAAWVWAVTPVGLSVHHCLPCILFHYVTRSGDGPQDNC